MITVSKTFTIYFANGKSKNIVGETAAEAFINAGYEGKLLEVSFHTDYYPRTGKSHKWDPVNEQWIKRSNTF